MERQGETGKEQAFHMDSRQKQEESGMDNQQKQGSLITDYGQITLSKNRYHHRIHLLNIIGEIEGHENLGSSSKTSKYEHILPQLAAVEDDEGIDGPSIGVPLAVSGDVTFIVPSATMVVHPIRMNGTVLGVTQNYEYIERMQDRIIEFTSNHCSIKEEELREIMFNTKELTKDIGSVLVGRQAVEVGIIDRVGGIHTAMNCLYDLINAKKNSKIEQYEHLN